jgi:hypothetical protein
VLADGGAKQLGDRERVVLACSWEHEQELLAADPVEQLERSQASREIIGRWGVVDLLDALKEVDYLSSGSAGLGVDAKIFLTRDFHSPSVSPTPWHVRHHSAATPGCRPGCC